jgi:type I restriction enzyme S subunit
MSFTASISDIVEADADGLLSRHPTWARVRLGDVCSILNGYPFPSGQFSARGGFRLLRIRDIMRSSTETGFVGDYDPLYVVRRGELVVGMDGDFNCALWDGPDALLNQRVCKVTADERYLSRTYLAYSLPGYLSAVNEATPSMTVKHLSSFTIADIPLPLAPKSEQARIAAALDDHLTRLDAAVAVLERVQRNLKRYRASVLKAAVEGRLVPTEAELARAEGRDYEPAWVLLRRILVERRRRWEESGRRGRYEEPVAPDTSGLPKLPEGWCWATWSQIGLSQNGRAFPSKEYHETGVRLLRPGNLHVSGSVEWTSKNTRHMPEKWATDFPGSIVGPHELVMNLTAQSLADEFLGRVCITGPAERCLLNQRIARLTPILVDARFMLWLFRAPVFRRFVNSLNTGSLIQHMFTSQLGGVVLPLPPKAEQVRIGTEVERYLTIADAIDGDIARNLARSSASANRSSSGPSRASSPIRIRTTSPRPRSSLESRRARRVVHLVTARPAPASPQEAVRMSEWTQDRIGALIACRKKVTQPPKKQFSEERGHLRNTLLAEAEDDLPSGFESTCPETRAFPRTSPLALPAPFPTAGRSRCCGATAPMARTAISVATTAPGTRLTIFTVRRRTISRREPSSRTTARRPRSSLPLRKPSAGSPAGAASRR